VNKSGNGLFPGVTKGVPRKEQDGHEAAWRQHESPNPVFEISSAQPHAGCSQTLPGFLQMVVLAGLGEIGSGSAGVNHLLITGGSGGLGRAVIQAFGAPGWNVSAPGRGQLDMRDPDSIHAALTAIPVDLLVCAAGTIRDAPLARMEEPMWDEVFSVNFMGAAACAAAVLPGMIGRRKGHIVFISSHSALHPPVGQAAYATAKAALLGLTEGLAREHGRHGIRVNAVLPGFIETAMTSTVSSRRKAEILDDHVLGRFNTPEAVAEFIRFLHERLPNTSGQVFQLDSRRG
jgi:3-oxoacyl-[acyl-carrier protein] reductase